MKPGSQPALFGQIDAVISAVESLRLHSVGLEQDLHDAVSEALGNAGIHHAHEVKIGPRSRVDFLTNDQVAIEIKKGKPNRYSLGAQAMRYCESDMVRALVLVVERNVQQYLPQHAGKPIRYVALNKQWGIAL